MAQTALLMVIVWIGGDCAGWAVDQVIGLSLSQVMSFPAIYAMLVKTMELEGVVGTSVFSTQMATPEHKQGKEPSVFMVRQHQDGLELELGNLLVEDTNNDAYSYIDCELHCSNVRHTRTLFDV